MDPNEYDNAPQEVKDILNTYNENKDVYKECKRILKQLEKIGWTADYYLDGILYDLKKL